MSKRKRYLCPHCDEDLSYRSFNTHKQLYFNESEGSWLKKVRLGEWWETMEWNIWMEYWILAASYVMCVIITITIVCSH